MIRIYLNEENLNEEIRQDEQKRSEFFKKFESNGISLIIDQQPTINYVAEANNFYLHTKEDAGYGVTLGNLFVKQNANKKDCNIEIKEPDITAPNSLVSLSNNQTFALYNEAEQIDDKKALRMAFDLLLEHNIIKSLYAIQNSKGNIIYNAFYGDTAINNINLIISEEPNELIHAITAINETNFTLNSDEQIKTLKSILNIHNELIHKSTITTLLMNFRQEHIQEIVNFYDNSNPQDKTMKFAEELESLRNNKEITNPINELYKKYYTALNNTTHRKVALLAFMGEESDAEKMGAFGNLYEYITKYPESSPFFTQCRNILKDYSINSINNELTKDNFLSTILADNLKNLTYNVIVPQGLSITNDEVAKILQETNDGNFRQNIVAVNVKDKTAPNLHGRINLLTDQQNFATVKTIFNHLSQLHPTNAIKYFDYSHLTSSDNDTIKNNINTIIEHSSAFNNSLIVVNENFQNSKLDELASINLENKKIYFTDIKHAEINNINQLIATKFIKTQHYELKNITQKSEEKATDIVANIEIIKQNCFLNRQKKKLFDTNNIEKNLDTIKTIAQASLQQSSVPIGIIGALPKANNKQNTPLGKLQHAMTKLEYNSPGFDLVDLNNNKPKINVAFAAEGAIRNALYPVSFDLSTQKQKAMFQTICMQAAHNARNVLEQKPDFNNLLSDILQDARLHKVILTTFNHTMKVQGGNTISTPTEIYTALTKDNEKLGNLPIPPSFIHQVMLDYGLIDMSMLETPKLTDDNIDKIFTHSTSFYANLINYIEKTAQTKPNELKDGLARFSKSLLSSFQQTSFIEIEKEKNNKAKIDVLGYFENHKKDNFIRLFNTSRGETPYNIEECLDKNITKYLNELFNYQSNTEFQNKLYKVKIWNESEQKKQNFEKYSLAETFYQDVISSNTADFKTLSHTLNKTDCEKIQKITQEFLDEKSHFQKSHAIIKETLLYYSFLNAYGQFLRHLISASNKLSNMPNLNSKFDFKSIITPDDFKIDNEPIDKKDYRFNLAYDLYTKLKANENIEDIKKAIEYNKETKKDLYETLFKEKYQMVNGLREHQVQAPLMALLSGTKNMSLQFQPRSGKTLATMLTLMLLNENDTSHFFVQQTNFADICRQAINFFPEFCHTINFSVSENKLKPGLIKPKQSKEFLDNQDILLRIPNKISSKYLNLDKAIGKLGAKQVLTSNFVSEILSIKEEISQYTKEKIEEIIKKSESPYLKTYYKFEEACKGITQRSNWQLSAINAFYLAYLHKNNYIKEDSAKEGIENIPNALIDDYKKHWEEQNLMHDNCIKLNISTKTLLEKTIPEDLNIKELSSKSNKKTIDLNTLKDLTYFKENPSKLPKIILNDGGRNVSCNDESIALEGAEATSKDNLIIKTRPERLEAINFHKNSDLKQLGKNGKIALWFAHDTYKRHGKSTSRIKCSLSDDISTDFNYSTAFLSYLREKIKSGASSIIPPNASENEAARIKDTLEITVDKLRIENIHQKFVTTPSVILRTHTTTQDLETHIQSVNDILIGKNEASILVFDINNAVKEFQTNILNAFKNFIEPHLDSCNKKLQEAKQNHYADEILQDLEFRYNALNKMTNFILDTIKNLNAQDISSDMNLRLLRQQYTDIATDSRKTQQNIADRFNSKKGDQGSLSIRFSNTTDILYGKEQCNMFSEYAYLPSIKLKGSVFSLADNDFKNIPLKNADFLMRYDTNSRVSFTLEQTEIPIKFQTDCFSKIINNSTSEIVFSNNKSNAISAMDETHKNENANTIAGTSIKKLPAKSFLSVSATPVDKSPTAIKVTFIKNHIPTLLQFLAETSKNDIFNELFKGHLRAKDYNNFFPKLQAYDDQTYNNIKHFCSQYDSLRHYASNPIDKLLNQCVSFMESVANKMKATNINTNPAWLNADFYRSIGFEEASIENKLKTEALYASCPSLRAVFQLAVNNDTTQILKDPKLSYKFLTGGNEKIMNNEVIALFKIASLYFTNNKINNVAALIKSCCELVFDSITNPSEDNTKLYENYNNETTQTKIAIENNQKFLEDRLKDKKYEGIKLSLSEILTSNNKGASDSAEELAYDLLMHEGNSSILENYYDKGKIGSIEQKILFIKNEILPTIREFINDCNFKFDDVDLNEKPNAYFIDEKTSKNGLKILIPGAYDYNQTQIVTLKEVEFSLSDDNKIKINGEEAKTFIKIKWGADEIKRYFPKVYDYLNDETKPFYAEIAPYSKTNSAFNALTDGHFYEDLSEKIRNGYKCPIFTDRIVSHNLITLSTLNLMIDFQAKQINPQEKNILILVTDKNSLPALKSINAQKLHAETNIDLHIVDDPKLLQNKLDELKSLNKEVDIYILSRRSAAEGIQLYDYTLEDDNHLIFADGALLTTNMHSTIQAVSRIDSIAKREEFKQKKQSDVFTIPFKAYGQSYTINNIDKFVTPDLTAELFKTGYITAEQFQVIEKIMSSGSPKIRISEVDSMVKAQHLITGQEKSFDSKPDTSAIACERFYDSLVENPRLLDGIREQRGEPLSENVLEGISCELSMNKIRM